MPKCDARSTEARHQWRRSVLAVLRCRADTQRLNVVGSAGRRCGQNEIRSIDWLSRSNETLIRIGRPAPSDEQLIALQGAIVRFLARLKDFALDAFRRIAGRQIQLH